MFDGINVEWFVGGHAVGVCDIEERGAKCTCLSTTE